MKTKAKHSFFRRAAPSTPPPSQARPSSPASPWPSHVRAFVLNFFDKQSGEAERGDDEATGIITTNFTNSTNSSNEWYSLDGVKLAAKPTAKGLYINNGKKVVIK